MELTLNKLPTVGQVGSIHKEMDATTAPTKKARTDATAESSCFWLQAMAKQFRTLHDSAAAQLERVEKIAKGLTSHSLDQHVSLLRRKLAPLDLRLNDFATHGVVACVRWRTHLELLRKSRVLADTSEASSRLAYQLAEKNRVTAAADFNRLVDECVALREEYAQFLDALSLHQSDLSKIQKDCASERRLAILKVSLAVVGGLLAAAGVIALFVFCPPAALATAAVAVCGGGAGAAAGIVGFTTVVTGLCGAAVLSGRAGWNALEALDKVKVASETAKIWSEEAERAYAACKNKRDGLVRTGNSCREFQHQPAAEYVVGNTESLATPPWEEFVLCTDETTFVTSIATCDAIQTELRRLQVA